MYKVKPGVMKSLDLCSCINSYRLAQPVKLAQHTVSAFIGTKVRAKSLFTFVNGNHKFFA